MDVTTVVLSLSLLVYIFSRCWAYYVRTVEAAGVERCTHTRGGSACGLLAFAGSLGRDVKRSF